MRSHINDLTGRRNGRLLVLGYAGPSSRWNVKCDCGTEKVLQGSDVRRVKSCGCLVRDTNAKRNFRHGDSVRGKVTAEYRCWLGMLRRCNDEKDDSYLWYGARGIKVCDRWLNNYPAFLEDMGRKPTPKHSIERSDNNGNYEPGNCHWAIHTEQMRNRRSRRQINFFGKPISASEAAELVGINYKVFLERLGRGWSEERALLTPVMKPFGGSGSERFSHTDHAANMLRVSEAVKAFCSLSIEERKLFLAAFEDEIADGILRSQRAGTRSPQDSTTPQPIEN